MRTCLVSLASAVWCVTSSPSAVLADTTGAPNATASSGAATGATQSAPQTSPSGEPCVAAGFRQFDFWAGEWDVVDASGKPAGRNTITIEQRGCVLVEHWTSAAGNTGMSINYYDPRARSWTQQWVGLGLLLTMTGGLRDGAMALEGPLQYLSTGKITRLRGTWSSLPDGRVRQHFEESFDEGRNWTEWFDGYYRRIAAASSGPSTPAN